MYLNINSYCKTFYHAVVPLKISADSVEDLFINHCSYCGDEGEEVLNAIARAKDGDDVSPYDVWDIAAILYDCFDFDCSQNVFTINTFEALDDEAEAEVIDDDDNRISFSIGDLEDDILDENAIPKDNFEMFQMTGWYDFFRIFDKNYFLEEGLNNINQSVEDCIESMGSMSNYYPEFQNQTMMPLEPGIYCGLFDIRSFDSLDWREFEVDGEFVFSKFKKRRFPCNTDHDEQGFALFFDDYPDMIWFTYNGNNIQSPCFSVGKTDTLDSYDSLQFYIFEIHDDGQYSILATLLEDQHSEIIRQEFYDELADVISKCKK